jgi:intraflagellar transport protein 52
MADDKGKKTILFNATKKETHRPDSGFKKLFRRLKSAFKISTNKDEVSRDRLAEADLLVFGGPCEPFTTAEFDEIKAFLQNGGRALVMVGDGGEKQSGTNMNFLLEEYGMSVNADSVLRSVYHKYLHPKEVFISDGVLVPDILRQKNAVALSGARKVSANKNAPPPPPSAAAAGAGGKLPFVYPYGASLSVERPARPLLSSGPVSYPLNRPIAAMWEPDAATATTSTVAGPSGMNKPKGRLVVLGSVEIFGDDWLDKEENAKLCDVLFSWLLGEVDLDTTSDRQDGELQEWAPVPHVEALGMSLKPCLQGMEELPRDFTKVRHIVPSCVVRGATPPRLDTDTSHTRPWLLHPHGLFLSRSLLPAWW